MRRKLTQVLQFIVFLGVGIALLYLAFKDMDFQMLWQDLKSANYFWVSLSLLAGVVAYWSRAVRWRLLIEPLGHKPPLSSVFFAVMIGYLANFAFPRIGEVTRCGALAKSQKIPLDSLLGTVIIERGFDLICLILLLVTILLAKLSTVGGFLYSAIWVPLQDKFISILAIGFWWWMGIVLAVATGIWILYFLRRKVRKSALYLKLRNIFKGVGEGLRTIAKMKNRKKFILHTFIIWGSYYLMTYLVFFALPYTSMLSPIDGVFILVVGGIGMSAPVQGGIGAYHWLVSMALMLYGVTKEEGLVYATLSHETQTILAIILGFISIIAFWYQRNHAQLKQNS